MTTCFGHRMIILRSTRAIMYMFLLCIDVLLLLFWSMYWFCVLFVCKRVLYYCHRVTTQLQFKYINKKNQSETSRKEEITLDQYVFPYYKKTHLNEKWS